MDIRSKRLPRRPENIFEYLHREHLRAVALLERLAGARGENCDELLFALERQLTVHAAAEEHTFYAALREFDETRFRVRRGAAAHAEIEDLVTHLSQLAPGGPGWAETLTALRHAVDQHIADESELFDAARSVLTLEDTRLLAREMEAEERRLDSGLTMHADELVSLAVAER